MTWKGQSLYKLFIYSYVDLNDMYVSTALFLHITDER